MHRSKMVLASLMAIAAATSAHAQGCPGNPNALGVARTVQIDTTGGQAFGFSHYKIHDFLQDKEVILTFDDGPQVKWTDMILEALKRHCTKATFFSVGKMAIGMPEIIRRVHAEGHTVGTHTWSHPNLRKKKFNANDAVKGIEEIEKGVSAIKIALGKDKPVAPFFRYPFLNDSQPTLNHLAKRNMGIFAMDVDSFDFRKKYRKSPGRLVKAIMKKLRQKGKGILLMHDIQPAAAKAMPSLLDNLKAGGFKIVHMIPAFAATSLPEYDKMVEKKARGIQVGAVRSTFSVVKTVK